jgi:hypothetical protein
LLCLPLIDKKDTTSSRRAATSANSGISRLHRSYPITGARIAGNRIPPWVLFNKRSIGASLLLAREADIEVVFKGGYLLELPKNLLMMDETHRHCRASRRLSCGIVSTHALFNRQFQQMWAVHILALLSVIDARAANKRSELAQKP